MIKTKRATVAAACAVGAAAGLISTSVPAFAAGTATAVYNCSCTDPASGTPVTLKNVNTAWRHSASSSLTIRVTIAWPAPVPVNGASTSVNGVTLSNVVLWNGSPPLVLGPTVVGGPILPPNPLVVLIVGPPAATVTCALVSSSGFPI